MTEKLRDVVKAWDMAEDMKQDIIQLCKESIVNPEINTEHAVATHIKQELKNRYAHLHGNWHCIVGRNFGSYVTFEKNFYIYLYLGQMAILIWKTG